MKRSFFLLISGVIALLIGSLMFLAPAKAAESFGIVSDPPLELFLRALGVMIIGAGVLNVLVRAHSDSPTLKAVLIFNIVVHVLSLVIDVPAVMEGALEFKNVIGSQVVHLFIGIGSIIFLVRMRSRG